MLYKIGCAAALLLASSAEGLQLSGSVPAVRARFVSPAAVQMNAAESSQVSITDADAVATPAAAEASMDMEGQAVENERFKAISINALDEWAEKFPRLQSHVRDIKLSAL